MVIEMQGTAFKPGNREAKDPVEREASRVGAVGCFFPPTDFLNYGKEGQSGLGEGIRNFRRGMKGDDEEKKP